MSTGDDNLVIQSVHDFGDLSIERIHHLATTLNLTIEEVQTEISRTKDRFNEIQSAVTDSFAGFINDEVKFDTTDPKLIGIGFKNTFLSWINGALPSNEEFQEWQQILEVKKGHVEWLKSLKTSEELIDPSKLKDIKFLEYSDIVSLSEKYNVSLDTVKSSIESTKSWFEEMNGLVTDALIKPQTPDITMYKSYTSKNNFDLNGIINSMSKDGLDSTQIKLGVEELLKPWVELAEENTTLISTIESYTAPKKIDLSERVREIERLTQEINDLRSSITNVTKEEVKPSYLENPIRFLENIKLDLEKLKAKIDELTSSYENTRGVIEGHLKTLNNTPDSNPFKAIEDKAQSLMDAYTDLVNKNKEVMDSINNAINELDPVLSPVDNLKKIRDDNLADFQKGLEKEKETLQNASDSKIAILEQEMENIRSILDSFAGKTKDLTRQIMELRNQQPSKDTAYQALKSSIQNISDSNIIEENYSEYYNILQKEHEEKLAMIDEELSAKQQALDDYKQMLEDIAAKAKETIHNMTMSEDAALSFGEREAYIKSEIQTARANKDYSKEIDFIQEYNGLMREGYASGDKYIEAFHSNIARLRELEKVQASADNVTKLSGDVTLAEAKKMEANEAYAAQLISLRELINGTAHMGVKMDEVKLEVQTEKDALVAALAALDESLKVEEARLNEILKTELITLRDQTRENQERQESVLKLETDRELNLLLGESKKVYDLELLKLQAQIDNTNILLLNQGYFESLITTAKETTQSINLLPDNFGRVVENAILRETPADLSQLTQLREMTTLLKVIADKSPIINVNATIPTEAVTKVASIQQTSTAAVTKVASIQQTSTAVAPKVTPVQPAVMSSQVQIPKSIQTDVAALKNELDRAQRYGKTLFGGSVEAREKNNVYIAELEKRLKAMGSYEVGTSYVAENQVAEIHKGEIIVDPKSSEVLRKYGIKVEPMKVNQPGDNLNLNKVENLLERQLDVQIKTLVATNKIGAPKASERLPPREVKSIRR